MGKIVFGGIVPHPPIMVPEVGRGEEKKVSSTLAAMGQFAKTLADTGPDLVVIISPHGSVFSDGVAINGASVLKGSLSRFGAPKVSLEYVNDLEFAGLVVSEAEAGGITAIIMDRELAGNYRVSVELDHGVVVPMYFVDRAGIRLPMVMVSMSMLPPVELYKFGIALQKAAVKSDRKVAVIASGDLSHRLTPDAPAGYAPEGKILDKKIVQAIKDFDVPGLVSLDPNLAEKGGECGWRSIIMMLGSLDGYEIHSEVLSYEGPFGVGYMVAVLVPGEASEKRKMLPQMVAEREKMINDRRANESAYVRLARETLEQYVREGKIPGVPDPLPEDMRKRAGVFVSIKKHGQLRGCIGTILPTTENLAQEIINNAISAGTRDPRFAPVREEELDELVYSVDVLKEPEPVDDMSQLDPYRYGVIVRKGHRTGLLLPNLEGIDTVEEQVAIARQKAGIGPDEPVELERFEVVRYY
ncbi:AmmeMemoRadiSam system protein A [Thermincola potens]|uniref:AMMECR1 domain protein n=1 Tax=Thermincola potens (strain JR) TaxID=635013 RepID=D5XAC3_THEPJ|nr:AmmeMemoRadiSam system protein A [Thermincola potens]ADG81222.1 AMMECR1 domain protein [Thermincola potens JR]